MSPLEWNFCKFLVTPLQVPVLRVLCPIKSTLANHPQVGPDGRTVRRYKPTVMASAIVPDAREMVRAQLWDAAEGSLDGSGDIPHPVAGFDGRNAGHERFLGIKA